MTLFRLVCVCIWYQTGIFKLLQAMHETLLSTAALNFVLKQMQQLPHHSRLVRPHCPESSQQFRRHSCCQPLDRPSRTRRTLQSLSLSAPSITQLVSRRTLSHSSLQSLKSGVASSGELVERESPACAKQFAIENGGTCIQASVIGCTASRRSTLCRFPLSYDSKTCWRRLLLYNFSVVSMIA